MEILNSYLFQIIYLVAILDIVVSLENDGHSESIAKCHRLRPQRILPTLEGLVGIGWDNLLNKAKLPIQEVTFHKCKTTPDGLFLIPDHIEVLPVKKGDMDHIAKHYDSYEKAFRSSAYDINLNSGIYIPVDELVTAVIKGYNALSTGSKIPEDLISKKIAINISGSFSMDYKEIKENMNHHKADLFVTKIWFHAYKIMSHAEVNLHPIFKRTLLKLSDAIARNLTAVARYLANTIIRDFGTHVLLQAEGGSEVIKEDYIDFKTLHSDDESIRKIAGSLASDWTYTNFKVGGSMNNDEKLITTIKTSRKHSRTKNHGGPNIYKTINYMMLYNHSIDLSRHIDLTAEDIFPLDASGMPIFQLLSEHNLLDIDHRQASIVAEYIKNATQLYYLKNAYPECFAFDFDHLDLKLLANCKRTEPGQIILGGFYKTCTNICGNDCNYATNKHINDECVKIRQINPITGSYSCPNGYEEALLYRHVLGFIDKGFFYDSNVTATVISVYSCFGKEDANLRKSYKFGGLFTRNLTNPLTEDHSCPSKFSGYNINVHYPSLDDSYNITVCLSDEISTDALDHIKSYSDDINDVKFGGFISPYTTLQVCPAGYRKYYIANFISLITNINRYYYYCAKPENYVKYAYENKNALRPPYGVHPPKELLKLLKETGTVSDDFERLAMTSNETEIYAPNSETNQENKPATSNSHTDLWKVLLPCIILGLIILLIVGVIVCSRRHKYQVPRSEPENVEV